jgi:type II secretory pathway pseudopilin PulG
MKHGKELVLVMAMIGLVAAFAVPGYVHQAQLQTVADKERTVGHVRSALVLAMADRKAFPTVEALASYVQGAELMEQSRGLRVASDNKIFDVLTYSDRGCRTPTTSKEDTIFLKSRKPRKPEH